MNPIWKDILEKWSMIKICDKCGAKYAEIEAIGRWECFQHCYTENTPKVGEVWRCCGKVEDGKRGNGCVPCDHNSRKTIYGLKDDIWLTPDAAPLVLPYNKETKEAYFEKRAVIDSSDTSQSKIANIRSSAYKIGDVSNKIGVRRFDYDLYQKLFNNTVPPNYVEIKKIQE